MIWLFNTWPIGVRACKNFARGSAGQVDQRGLFPAKSLKLYFHNIVSWYLNCNHQGRHREFFEAEFHFELNESGRKKRKKHRQKRPKKDDAEEFEFKPNVNELLKNVERCSDPDSNCSEEHGDENVFEQSDNYEEEANEERSTLLEGKNLENQEILGNKEEGKLEEDEVKMEAES